MSGSSAVFAEKLDAAGVATGEEYYLKVTDLKDAGDGGETVDLPISKKP